MKPEEKAEFSQLLAGVAELYGKGVSRCLFEIYWYALEKYSLDNIKRVIGVHIVNPDVGQFMPKPADFARYIEGKSQEKALFAWEKVLAAMRVVGAYDSIVFDDPLIHYVIDKLGGWIVVCHTAESKLPFLFQDFSRYYLACLAHPVSGYPKKLTGITAHLNGLEGQSIPDPIFFDGTPKISHVKTLERKHREKLTEIKVIEEKDEAKSNV